MDLEELKSLDKRQEINRLQEERNELDKEIQPIRRRIENIQTELRRLERDKRQAVVDYHIEKIIAVAVKKYHLPKWTEEKKNSTKLREGKIAIYDSYSGKAWYILVNENLEILDLEKTYDFLASIY